MSSKLGTEQPVIFWAVQRIFATPKTFLSYGRTSCAVVVGKEGKTLCESLSLRAEGSEFLGPPAFLLGQELMEGVGGIFALQFLKRPSLHHLLERLQLCG